MTAKVLGLVAVAAGAGAVAYSMPELRRYLKIRQM
jgi:hypothetical protein